MKRVSVFLIALFCTMTSLAQTIENVLHDLPQHFSILTTWGLRPEWDETSENIYFLNKMVGDVFKINIKTRDRYNLEMYILKKDNLKNPISLGEYMDEGPAVSRNNMKIAWTLYGQREIVMADIEYSNGIPKLVNKKTIVNYNDSAAYVRLESQDFRPPLDEELIYTHYWGDEKDAFHHSQTYGYNIKTGKTTDYTHLPDSYNEAEGIFPDGKYVLIESDRHQPMQYRNQYKLDVYKLKLDSSSGEAERLADFSTRYTGKFRSDNPLVDRTGKYIAVQFGFMKGAGDGQGIFLFDLDKYEKWKKVH